MTIRDLDYPRPQLRRDRYKLLNGIWYLNGSPIRVPFPPESRASGFHGEIRNTKGELVYEKEFAVPGEWAGERILLHFGAVDQLCGVSLDGAHIGRHEGGYLPFTFDLGRLEGGTHLLRVTARDDLSTVYPYGKQSRTPKGMWYTMVSGIWQSVWIEPVPDARIDALKLMPDREGIRVRLFTEEKNPVEAGGKEPFSCEVVLHADGMKRTLRLSGKTFRLDIARIFKDIPGHPHLWTPDDPYLYEMDIRFGEDLIHSYFALRTVEVRNRTAREMPGVFLNGKRIFLKGVLDQGYFPEGIYVPDSPEEYLRDIVRMKEFGFNTLRKHAKVEPEQYYYLCDCLGMLVMQDIVNSGRYSLMCDTVLPTVGFHLWPFLAVPKSRIGGLTTNLQHAADEHMKLPGRERFRRRFFEYQLRGTLKYLFNHPCVIAYTIFNEGWGQYDSDRLYLLAKKLDGSRTYDTASGWFKGEYSDFDSLHVYYRNERVRPARRPLLLTEVGGFEYNAEPEAGGPANSYGYGKCTSEEELRKRIRHMLEGMIEPVRDKGLAGYIYTQLSDVETERNGIYTYDRRTCKLTLSRGNPFS